MFGMLNGFIVLRKKEALVKTLLVHWEGVLVWILAVFLV